MPVSCAHNHPTVHAQVAHQLLWRTLLEPKGANLEEKRAHILGYLKRIANVSGGLCWIILYIMVYVYILCPNMVPLRTVVTNAHIVCSCVPEERLKCEWPA